jgi:dienelactone hydrolase
MGFELDLRASAWWPEREDLSIEFTRLLGAGQEGGSAFAECCAAACRIDISDEHSWYGEWKKLADASSERARAALRQGHVLTARSNWLRAIGYYQSAAYPFDFDDEKRRVAVESMRQCARDYLSHGDSGGEVIEIPWPDGYPLEAYFLPAATAKPAPAIICIGEPGQHKEEYLYKLARYARERGMSLLAVDLLGSGDASFESIAGRPDLERTIGHIMDHLVEREDVDRGRIAILADGWGSSFVARGVALDGRFAAAVCDGGIWDLHERVFLLGDNLSLELQLGRHGFSRVARGIKCPVLVCSGEHAWLKSERVRELYDCLKADGSDITLRIFSGDETASMQGHADNPTLANEFIFDWLAARLNFAAR